MIKDLLVVAYIASIIYCFYQLVDAINQAVELFQERHPLLPLDESPGWKGLKLGLELLLLSSLPVANIALGYICASLPDSALEDIVRKVELDHWSEIRNWEEEAKEREDLSKYF